MHLQLQAEMNVDNQNKSAVNVLNQKKQAEAKEQQLEWSKKSTDQKPPTERQHRSDDSGKQERDLSHLSNTNATNLAFE